MIFYYKGRRRLRFIIAISELAPIGSSWIPRISQRRVTQFLRAVNYGGDKGPRFARKASKERATLTHFSHRFLSKALQFWKKREYIFRLSCAITTDGLERHFVNDIDLFVASRNVSRIFFFFLSFFFLQRAVLSLRCYARARGEIWITTRPTTRRAFHNSMANELLLSGAQVYGALDKSF